MSRIKNFQELRKLAVKKTSKSGALKLALACGEDPYALKALSEAKTMGLVQPILVGCTSTMNQIADEAGFDLSGFEIVEEQNPQRAAAEAAVIVANKDADLLMKGKILAFEFLEAALHDGVGLKKSHQIWTHVGIFWPEALSRFLLVTDGGVIIDPELEDIPAVIGNALKVTEILKISNPKVALLAAVETVYPNMPVAMGGAVISKMADRGQIKNAIIDGPLSLDVAISPDAAKEKKVAGKVPGYADVLVVNNIEVGNALCKSIFIFGRAQSAGLVIGARQPIIMSSRSESVEAKVNSIALAILLANHDGN